MSLYEVTVSLFFFGSIQRIELSVVDLVNNWLCKENPTCVSFLLSMPTAVLLQYFYLRY